MLQFARSSLLCAVKFVIFMCSSGLFIGMALAQNELLEVALDEPFTINGEAGQLGVVVTPTAVGAMIFVDANGQQVEVRWVYEEASQREATDAPAVPNTPVAVFPPLGGGTNDPTFTVIFDAEPFQEPNDTLELAQEIAPGEVVDFRLMPRWDRDVFAVSAPADGAFALEFLELGGHEPVVAWLRADGSEAINDLETTVRVSAGETVYARVYGNDYYWNEQGRPDPLQLRVLFSEETFQEPNDTLELAQEIEVNETIPFRLMPRWDRDFFAVIAPARGTLQVELLESGGHPKPQFHWFLPDGSEAPVEGRWGTPVEPNEIRVLRAISDDHFWSEQGLPDRMAMRVKLRLPDGQFLGESRLSEGLVLRPWLRPEMPAGVKSMRFSLTAPQSGRYRLAVWPDAQAVITWRDEENQITATSAFEDLAAGDMRTIEASRPEGTTATPLTFELQLQALSLRDQAGSFPRLPDVLVLRGGSE